MDKDINKMRKYKMNAITRCRIDEVQTEENNRVVYLRFLEAQNANFRNSIHLIFPKVVEWTRILIK